MSGDPALVLDCRGWRCPRPILELGRRIGEVPIGAEVEVIADDPAAGPDLTAWCRMRGQELRESRTPHFRVRRVR